MSPLRLGTRASLLAQCQSQWVAAELQARGRPGRAGGGQHQRRPAANAHRRDRRHGRVHQGNRARVAGRPRRSGRPQPQGPAHRRGGRAVPGGRPPTGVGRRRPPLRQVPCARTNCPRRPRWGPAVSAAGHNCCTRGRTCKSATSAATSIPGSASCTAARSTPWCWPRPGLERLGLADQIAQRLPTAIMLPAVGQGALALEVRGDDRRTRQLVQSLDHPASHAAVAAERAMLAALHGGCLAPVAAWGRFDQDRPDLLTLTGRVLSPDGVQKIEATRSAAAGRGRATGPSRGRRPAGPRCRRPDRVGTAIAALTSTSDTAGVPRLPRGSEFRYTTFSAGGLCPPDG